MSASYTPSTSPTITQIVGPTTTIVEPAANFTVLSGQMAGNPDGSISVNIARLRAILNSPIQGLTSIKYHFRIAGDSPTISVDSDGVTRQGVVLWANVQNACNLYFLSWRTDSREAVGTSVVEVQRQVNPGIIGPITNAQLNACAGVGYSLLLQPTGMAAKIVSNINIMDGNWHDFTVVFLGPGHWRVYADNVLAFEAFDPNSSFPVDSGLYGLRTDNVNVQVYFEAIS